MDHVPTTHHNPAEHRRLIANLANLLIPAVGSVTLTTLSATTTVTDVRMGEGHTVVLTPTDANAAAEAWHISSKLNGSFVITHAVSATTRNFDYLIVG